MEVSEWPLTPSGRWGGHTGRHSSCWLARENAELVVIFLCPLTLLNYPCVIALGLFLSPSASPSFPGSAGGWEWLSVAEPNRSSQIHNTPSVLSQAWGEQLLIFKRTLHYHSGRNTAGINTEAPGDHAQHLHNIYTSAAQYWDAFTS